MDEPFDDRIRRRIDKVTPIRSTRMGPAIRHTTWKLEQSDAKARILFLVSDGEETFGSLNMYSSRAHAFDAHAQALGQVFASHAAVALKAAITEAGLEQAIQLAQQNNPTVMAAQADVDAAHGRLKGAESAFYPTLSLEGRARAGRDLDGVPGDDNELQAGVVLNWNLFRGGIDRANRQEQIRRIDEATMVLYQIAREVEEAVQLSWDRRQQQARRLAYLREQLGSVRDLVQSYADQFAIGQRSLVDLLDAQNARVNAEIAVWTAEAAVQLAEYRILAATGTLLAALEVAAPPQSAPYARAQARVPPAPPPEALDREPPFSSPLGPLY